MVAGEKYFIGSKTHTVSRRFYFSVYHWMIRSMVDRNYYEFELGRRVKFS